MKRIKILLAGCLSLVMAISFNACKKNKEAKAPLTCRITAFTLAGQVYQITYNSNGKVIHITNNILNQTYEYSQNATVITISNSGVFSSRVIATINNAGLATNVRTENNISGTDWSNIAYEYNGDEVIRQTATSSSDTFSAVSTYTWFNHNIISQTSGTSTQAFTYYADKLRQNGDYFDFVQLISGYEYLRTKNLVKSIGNSDLIYDFGTDGNIASLTVTSPGGIPSSINYEYECK